MLKVKGLACPWNVYNSYHELMKPGAFARYLNKLHGEPVPMGFMHNHPCGIWDKLTETGRGLEVEGTITDDGAAELVKHSGEFRQLSISYRLPKGNLVETEARLNSRPPWERARTLKEFRILPHIEVTDAGLGEISIVDDGAFPGTHLDIL